MKAPLLFISILSVVTARRSVPIFPMAPKPDLSPYGPTKIGTWGLPNVEKKEVKEVKRTVTMEPRKCSEEKHCGPWGVHSVHELEEIMGLE
ncbi:hypothetical protein IV203_021230 [Nitzschia inconspicua]|uniref:Uncharacterized protein n=1 Tax=Nitzschia inconspicua TaxID=303405 RepID=A0A9K3PDR8_9STRA|nr:hypothetical protein IV203_021230 [Nitzschia inconspicua]